MNENKKPQKYARVDYDDDTTLILSERLLNSLFDHIKDGLNRTEQLVQDMSQVVIIISEKQDDVSKILSNFENNIKYNNDKVVDVLDNHSIIFKTRCDENVRDHDITKDNLKTIIDDIRNIESKIRIFMTTTAIINIIIGLITCVLSWFVFFKP